MAKTEAPTKAWVMRGFLELARTADLKTQVKARRNMNRALRIFSSREVSILTPAQLKRLYAAAESYILDPANNVSSIP